MADSDRQGTEAPTQRRREESRKDGQVVQSPDLSAAAALTAGFVILLWFGSPIGRRLMQSFSTWFQRVPSTDWTALHTQLGARWLMSEMAGTCGVILIVLTLVSLLIGFLQVGFLVSWKPLAADWNRVNPAKGLERLFSAESAIRGVLGSLKVSLLLTVATMIIWFRRGEFSAANFTSLHELLGYGWDLALTVGLALAGVVLCLGAVDFITKWYRHEQKLRMTHDEIKREQKEELGDPTLRVAMRRRQREAVRQRSVADVPHATVVLTNPTHLAVAVRYDRATMSAPVVVAKGAGVFAKNIVAIARKHKVPVMERRPLARALYRSVRTGQEIPTEFFRAVAEILAQIYRMRQTAA